MIALAQLSQDHWKITVVQNRTIVRLQLSLGLLKSEIQSKYWLQPPPSSILWLLVQSSVESVEFSNKVFFSFFSIKVILLLNSCLCLNQPGQLEDYSCLTQSGQLKDYSCLTQSGQLKDYCCTEKDNCKNTVVQLSQYNWKITVVKLSQENLRITDTTWKIYIMWSDLAIQTSGYPGRKVRVATHVMWPPSGGGQLFCIVILFKLITVLTRPKCQHSLWNFKFLAESYK
jgi:hypothetical protein